MKALIWKEWREHIKLAFAVFVLVSFELVRHTILSITKHPIAPDFDVFENSAYLTFLLAPLFAGALGHTQISQDQRADHWAYLTHRPVSRTTIFWSKVFGGLSLYMAAFILPLLGLATWCSLQRLVPIPNQWENLEDSVEAVMVMSIFYFPAMLMALRRTRWYGSRFLPLPATLLFIAACLVFDEEWQYILIEASTFLLFGLAAWGNLLSDGNFVRMPRIAKMAQGIVTYIGLLVPVYVVASVFLSMRIWSALQLNQIVHGLPSISMAKTKGESGLGLGIPGVTAENQKILSSRWQTWVSSPPWFLGAVPTISTSPLVALSLVK
ncbi:hypothetical protein EON80_17970, partial [bacterium]